MAHMPLKLVHCGLAWMPNRMYFSEKFMIGLVTIILKFPVKTLAYTIYVNFLTPP